jgi:hypothetical protein
VLAAGAVWWVAADPAIEVQPAQTTPPVMEEPIEPEPAVNGLESFLPEFDNTIRREVGRIEAGATYVLQVPSDKNGEYRLQYVCLGPGDLAVRIRGTVEGDVLHNVDCEGNLSAFGYVAAGTRVVIEVHRPGEEPADMGVQVIDVE